MTNSDSLDAESATAPTTKPESDALNMSAGAEMLIERMKTNPDDFIYGGRFYKVRTAIERTSDDSSGWISPRDFEALVEAYGRLILEPLFSEWVYNEIFNPKEEEPSPFAYSNAMAQGQKAQMQQAMLNSTRSGMYASGMTNALQGVGLWQGAVPPNMAVGLTEPTVSAPAGIFKSIKNTLGI
jgi:hypothetical protein